MYLKFLLEFHYLGGLVWMYPITGIPSLGTDVLSMVSDRAKALIQLAEQGLECLSMPDCFHVVHDIIKSYALAIGRHLSPSAPRTHASQGAPSPTPGLAPSSS
jgi:hypothetical protein